MRQEERVIASRKKILETSIIEFGKKGYKEASTNEICDACGISKGLVYYHFKSKQRLFEECATYCIEEFDNYMKHNFVKSSIPMEGIRECCLLRKDFFFSHPHYHQLFCQVLYERDEKNSNKYLKLLEKYKQHSYEIISIILDEIEMNTRIVREEGIKWAVVMIEVIDTEIFGKFQNKEETEQMLEEQMKRYESFLEMLFCGILKQ